MHHARVCLAAALCLGGCTSLSDYVNHGFKVGPEYSQPRPKSLRNGSIRPIPHRQQCRRSEPLVVRFQRSRTQRPDRTAYRQNINLKEYGTRILQARAQLSIVKGEVFPQTSKRQRRLYSRGGPVPEQHNWNMGFNLAWELDFWGSTAAKC